MYNDLASAYNGSFGADPNSYMNYGQSMSGFGGNNGGYGFNNSQPNYGYGMQNIPNQMQNQQPKQNNGMGASSLLTSIPSVLSGFGLIGNQNGQNNINALGNNSANISNAMNNPNNPLYQQMYGQQKEQNMNNLASATSMLQGQNRLQSAMGRTPLFAQGRGGEEIFRNLMQGYQNNDANAQQQVHNQLAQNLQGSNQSLMAAQAQNNANKTQNNSQLNSFDSIAQLLKGFM